MIKQLIDVKCQQFVDNCKCHCAGFGNQGFSLQKIKESLGTVVTCLLNATLVRCGYVFKKCKARQVGSCIYQKCWDIIGCFEHVKQKHTKTMINDGTWPHWKCKCTECNGKSSTLASIDGRCQTLFIMSLNLPERKSTSFNLFTAY